MDDPSSLSQQHLPKYPLVPKSSHQAKALVTPPAHQLRSPSEVGPPVPPHTSTQTETARLCRRQRQPAVPQTRGSPHQCPSHQHADRDSLQCRRHGAARTSAPHISTQTDIPQCRRHGAARTSVLTSARSSRSTGTGSRGRRRSSRGRTRRTCRPCPCSGWRPCGWESAARRDAVGWRVQSRCVKQGMALVIQCDVQTVERNAVFSQVSRNI